MTSNLAEVARPATVAKNRVTILPAMITWARHRSRLAPEILNERFPALSDWESGTQSPTHKQAQAFANAVYVPLDHLMLPEPPEEPDLIPDRRTAACDRFGKPGPNLIDMVAICRDRQQWYREFVLAHGPQELPFIGCLSLDMPPESAAEVLRNHLEFGLEERRQFSNWSDSLRHILTRADSIGVLAMVSGIVLSNPHRLLDITEFSGFALTDTLAPLVFVNGSEIKAVQMFNLVRELVHLWLGVSALSESALIPAPSRHKQEVWCSQVAMEFLMPLAAVRAELIEDEKLALAMGRLARRFKVSTLIVLRRLLDVQVIDRPLFEETWANERHRLIEAGRKRGRGGNFYTQTVARIGPRFTRALMESTFAGKTEQREALRMVGISKAGTLTELGRSLGLME